MLRVTAPVCAGVVLAAVFVDTCIAAVGASSPPNLVPEMTFSYVDPVSGERRECGDGCRRFEVPAGVDLEIRMRVRELGDSPGSDGVNWDLWFDQPRRPFPPDDPAVCFDDDQRLDADCYDAMLDRVDWKWWDQQKADRVCLPEDAGDCLDETLSLPLDADFDGSRGRGVYTFMVWVDRFDTQVEINDFDNVAGPVRVKVLPRVAIVPVGASVPAVTIDSGGKIVEPASADEQGRTVVFAPASPKPFAFRVSQAEAEKSFNLSSRIARANLEFVVPYPGHVAVEVEQDGVWEKMVVELRKVSTGEIFAEGTGKGRLRLEARVEKVRLIDDRLFEVVVRHAQGTWGLRGTMRVSYPNQGVFIRNE